MRERYGAKFYGTSLAPASYRRVLLLFKWSECLILSHYSLSSCYIAFSLLCFLAFRFHIFFLQLPKVFPSTIMSTFMSDSTISLNGSDSAGLIEQSIMDWEVISIGGSSSEDTRQGASDSESFSSEKVRASRHADGGASRPHRRV